MLSMAAAPSHDEREGAVRAQVHRRQGIDYDEGTEIRAPNAADVPNISTITIAAGPISWRTLVFWGVVIFAGGFFHGRQMSNLSSNAFAPSAVTVTPAAGPSVAPASATPASNATAASQVGIRLLKFSPETVEVRTGQVVEWANSDLTPHTVTSQGSGELNSGSIDAGASWRHTFTQTGSFPYFCTFHPEMKGTVVVK